jgi:hypothetical protein
MKKLSLLLTIVLLLLCSSCAGKYPGEILYESEPITRFLEMTKNDIVNEFGESNNKINSYSNTGISGIAYSDNTDKVIYIQFNSSSCTLNKKGLQIIERDLVTLFENSGAKLNPSINRTADNNQMVMRFGEQDYFRTIIDYYTIDIILYSNLIEGEHVAYQICLYTDEWDWDLDKWWN